jgi:hypothetical protein
MSATPLDLAVELTKLASGVVLLLAAAATARKGPRKPPRKPRS